MIKREAIYWVIMMTIMLMVGNLSAQQLPQYTQYMFNNYLNNPAFSAHKDCYRVVTGYRSQWTGITGAPNTGQVSIYGPTNSTNFNRKIGIGGTVYTDKIGSTMRTGVYGSFAWHTILASLNSKDDLHMGLGLSGGFSQYKVNLNDVTLTDIDDPALAYGVESIVLPDAIFGALFYSNNYYLGVSVHQLIRSKFKIFDIELGAEPGRLYHHYFVNGGYTFDLTNVFDLEMAMMVKQTRNLPLHCDFTTILSMQTLKLTNQNKAWVGISYRTQDAIAMLIGYTYHRFLQIGYSYDFTTSNLKYYSNGTHEIIISYRFCESPLKPMID